MATFNKIDQEKIAESDKNELRKANTFGSDKSSVEEPFGISQIVLREDIFSETPTANTNFASPNYGDWPSGNIASRRVEIRLHPVLASGLTGPESIQTFMTVSSAPASDETADIEAVRIKQLVPPDLSPGRTNAADTDVNFRGFELVLYPAKSGAGGALEADTTKPIPITADPTSFYGVGSGARWTVDYANGIVRFSEPPLNGSTGVMNPNDVYGDLYGEEVAADGYNSRITIFATFYQYTGPSLTEVDDLPLVTVGDGVNSFGTYYGADSGGDYAPILQQAIDSLYPYGGTVFLKEGDYTYSSSVSVSTNVNILGLSSGSGSSAIGVNITRPDNLPAFVMSYNNANISGITIKTTGSTASRAAIEISARSDEQTLENVSVKNSEIWANVLAYGIGFAPKYDNVLYKNIDIDNNVFNYSGNENPIYIGEAYVDDKLSTASALLEDVRINNNYFKLDNEIDDGYAFLMEGQDISDIKSVSLTNNRMFNNVDIGVGGPIAVDNLEISHNADFRNIYMNSNQTIANSTVSGNRFNDLHLDGYVLSNTFDNNTMSHFRVISTEVYGSSISSNSINFMVWDGDVVNTHINNNEISSLINNSTGSYGVMATGNLFNDAVAFGSLTNSMVDENVFDYSSFDAVSNISLSGNMFLADTSFNGNIDNVSLLNNVFSSQMSCFGLVNDTSVTNNIFSSAVGFYRDTETITNSVIANNIFNDTLTIDYTSSVGSIKFSNFIGNYVYDDALIDVEVYDSLISGNIFYGGADTASALTFDEPVQDVTISGNYLADFIVPADGNLSYTSINGNLIQDNFTTSSTLTEVAISDNVVVGSVSLDNTTGSSVSGNITGDAFTVATSASQTTVSSNYSFGHMRFDTLLSESVVSSNACGGVLYTDGYVVDSVLLANYANSGYEHSTGNMANTVLSDNVFPKMSSTNQMVECSLTGNVVYDYAGTSSFTGADASDAFKSSVMSSNVFNNALVFVTRAYRSSVCSNSIGSINFSYTDGTAAVYDTVIQGNNVRGVFRTDDEARYCSITGNIVNGDTTISTGFYRSVFSDNMIGAEYGLTITAPNSSTISNNNIAGTFGTTIATDSTLGSNFVIGAVSVTSFTRCVLNDNAFSDTLTVSGATSDSTMTGNKVGDTVTFSGGTSSSVFGSNYFGEEVSLATSNSGLVFSGNIVETVGLTLAAPTNCVVSSNYLYDIAAGAANQLTLGGNYLAAASTITSLTNCSLYSNYFVSTLTMSGAIQGTTIADSIFDGLMTVSTGNSSDSIISNNLFNGGIDITAGDGLDKVMFDGNTITGNMALGRIVDCVVGNNYASGGFSLSSSYAGVGSDGIAETSIITGNRFSSISIADTSAAGTDDAAVFGSIISDNRTDGNFIVSSTNNACIIYSSLVGNSIGLSVSVTSSGGAGKYAIDRSSVSDNVIVSTLSIDNDSATGLSLYKSSFTGNYVGSTANIGTSKTSGTDIVLDYATISNNIFGGAFNVCDSSLAVDSDSHTDSIISDNVFVSTATISGKSDRCVFEDNTIGDAWELDAIGQCVVSGNIGTQLTVSGLANLSVVSDNALSSSIGFAYTGGSYALSNSVVSDNYTSSSLLISDGATDCVFTGNNVSTTWTFSGVVTKSVMSGNAVGSAGASNLLSFASTITDSVVSGNYLYDLGISGTTSLSTITGNHINQNASVSTLSGSSLVGNVFDENLTISNVSGSVVIGNVVDSGTLTISTTNTNSIITSNYASSMALTGSLSNTIFTSNRITNNFTASGGSTNCSFVGNYIAGICTFSGAVSSTALSGNYIGSNLVFSYAVGNSIVGSSVSNNVCGGTFTAISNLTDSSIISGNYLNAASLSGSGGLQTSIFLENRISSGDVTFGSVVGSSVSNNYFPAACASTGGLAQSSFSGNQVTTILTFAGVVDESAIVGNYITGSATNGILFTYAAGSNSIEDSSIVSNVIATGGMIFSDAIGVAGQGCLIASNSISGGLFSVAAGGCIDSSIVGNAFKGTGGNAFSITGLINKSSVSNNTFAGTCVVNTGLTNSSFLGNQVNSTLTVTGAITTSYIGSNTVTGACTSNNGLTNSSFSSNLLGSTLTFGTNAAITGSIMSGNYVVGAVDFGYVAGSNCISDTAISSNVFGSTVQFDDRFSDCLITSNSFGDLCDINNSCASSSITGNVFKGDGVDTAMEITGAVTGTAITSNGFVLAVIINDGFSSSTFSGNQVTNATYGLVRFNTGGVVNDAIISDNYIEESLEFKYIASTDSVTNSTITSNVVGGTALFDDRISGCLIGLNSAGGLFDVNNAITGSSIVGNVFGYTGGTYSFDCAGLVSSSSLNSNWFGNDIRFATGFSLSAFIGNQTDSTSNVIFTMAITSSSVSNNQVSGYIQFYSINNSIVSNNYTESYIKFTNGCDTSLIVGNRCGSNTGGVQIYEGFRNSAITSNMLGDTTSPDRALYINGDSETSSIGNNSISGDVVFDGGFSSSSFSGNQVIDGYVGFGDVLPVENSNITGNYIEESLQFAFVGGANSIQSSAVVSNIVGSGGMSIAAICNGCLISGNYFSGNISFSQLYRTSFSSNSVIGTTTSTYSVVDKYTVYECSITGNLFSGVATFSYTGGGGAIDCGVFIASVISGNLFDDDFDVTTTQTNSSSAALQTAFSSNTFDNGVTFSHAGQNPNIWQCSMAANVFTGIVSFNSTHTSSGGPFNDLVFSGNMSLGTISFTSSWDGNSVFQDGSIVGNMFGSVQFGNSVELAHHFTRITFVGNTGNSASFKTDNNSNFTDVVIVGNAMSGTLTIGKSGTTTYNSPPGANDPVIALNKFGSYSGITFDNTKSIGWGTNTGDIAAPNSRGSNL